jgi:hypothetical protein
MFVDLWVRLWWLFMLCKCNDFAVCYRFLVEKESFWGLAGSFGKLGEILGEIVYGLCFLVLN